MGPAAAIVDDDPFNTFAAALRAADALDGGFGPVATVITPFFVIFLLEAVVPGAVDVDAVPFSGFFLGLPRFLGGWFCFASAREPNGDAGLSNGSP